MAVIPRPGRSVNSRVVAPAPVGKALEARGFTAHRFVFARGARLETHEHDRPAVRILLSGSYAGLFGGRRYECRSGDVALLPAAVPHFEEMGDQGGNAVLLLPRADSRDDRDADTLAAFRVMRDVRTRHAAWRLAVNWTAPDDAAPLAVEHHIEEVLGLVRGRGGGTVRHLPPGIHHASALLDASTTGAPSLDEVAAHAALSRAQLTRLFRRTFGCSVGEYLRRSRLDRAALMLRDGRQPLATVALACGFYDQSHFTNAFRNRFGCTPRSFRRAQRVDETELAG